SLPCSGWRTQRQLLIVRAATDARDQVELAAHFVAHDASRLRVRPPIGQELIGILIAVRQPQRNSGQVAQEGRGQRVLTVHREDHGGVEVTAAQGFDLGSVRVLVGSRRRRFYPRRFVNQYLVDLGDQRCDRAAGGRGQQGYPTAGNRAFQSPQRRCCHE